MFTEKFTGTVYAGETITCEVDGFTVTATIHSDDDTTPPWEREDGHGEVTGWTRRAKMPGELVLNTDGGSHRYYDFAGACATARRDGWRNGEDAARVQAGEPVAYSARQVAARAALADYERLRRWCADLWEYVGVSVTVTREDDDGDPVELVGEYEHALWGIESDCPDYLTEMAAELAGEALEAARAAVGDAA